MAAKGAEEDTYKVVRGDTLYRIARKYGVDYRDLAKWNGIKDTDRIDVGQELKIKAP